VERGWADGLAGVDGVLLGAPGVDRDGLFLTLGRADESLETGDRDAR
jgi:hypothetical protein